LKRKHCDVDNDGENEKEKRKKKKRKQIVDDVDVNLINNVETVSSVVTASSVVSKTKTSKKKSLANQQKGDTKTRNQSVEVVESPIQNNSVVTAKKKKNKRRSKSDALAKTKDIPLVPWDLMSLLDKHFKQKLSTVEMDELQLNETHFTLCNDLTHTATSYLKTLVPHWKKLVKGLSEVKGSPLILVVCKSGQRAADFIRAIHELQVEGCKVAKLFAKHLKIEDQVKFLQKHSTHIGVGSPNRMQCLIENGALKLDHVKYVVLDWSDRDVKLQRLMDIKEVRSDVVALMIKHIIPKLRTGSAKIGLL